MADSARAPTGPRASSPPSALSLPALLPSSTQNHSPPKRADLISIKQRLAQLLAPRPDLGELYWSGLTEFILGKITRAELGEVLERCFIKSTDRIQAINLHNALLLSILYNTTRPTLPSSSIRHTGFNPRGTKKRNLLTLLGQGGYEGDEETEQQEQRRKKIKKVVLRVGKRERAEIKANANNIVKKEDGIGGEGNQETVGNALKASRGGQETLANGFLPKAYKEDSEQGNTASSNFTQDYNRLIQAPLCCESRSLPDADTLRDRMLLIAYEEGMVDGIDGPGVANLLSNAVDYYVKQVITSAVSLVRGPSHQSNPLPFSSSSSEPKSTFAPASGSFPADSSRPLSPLPEVSSPGTPSSSATQRRRNRPLAISDFHALFAVQPALLGPNGSTHTSAVERMYALPPQSDSDDDSVEEEEGDNRETAKGDLPVKDATGDTNMSLDEPPPNSAPTAVSGKIPRLSTASRNRALSFYGAARPLSALPSSTSSSPHGTPGRTKFLLDPTSLHGVPEGHPDVPHVSSSSVIPPLSAPTTSTNSNEVAVPNPTITTGAPSTVSAGATNSQALSPKSLSLRNSLFPELANPPPSSTGPAGSAPGSAIGASTSKGSTNLGGENGNGTTTDEADSEFDELTDKIAGELRGGVEGKKGASSGLKNSTTAGGGGGLKIKLGGTTTGTVTPTPTASNVPTPGGSGGPGAGTKTTGEKDKEMGRKLWEVVDSVRLLDGVLDP
ncbi:Hfi1p [Sporobolomyces salmoneus]|uniref:Hfi1p n=1 Tax=Sporobolomyces salmoneus TaxID=183962 RepID=UPI00317FF11A